MEIQFKDILRNILKHIWIVILVPLAAAVITGFIVSYVIPPVYTASASMYVLNKNGEDDSVNYSDLQSSTLLTADYREIALSKTVLSAVADEYGLNAQTIQREYKIGVTNKNSTRIIVISATAEDPVLAADLANAVGKKFASTVVDITNASNVNFVDMAEVPRSPSAPKKLRTVLIAAFIALLLCVFIVELIEILNTTIRTVDDVEKKLGLTVLARIPKFEVE
ncbi:MAG: hypothetical protein IKR03_01565 [Clostridia bacterium]|nr:hypothetical protein [Christensenellaceae bacterium]MBR6239446.1 hypothetical protein [Clostridia bacterium]